MGIFELIGIAFGLAMDAAAVSICKGLATGRVKLSHCLTAGTYFGGFQGLMPAIGYLLGAAFAEFIGKYDAWVAFVLLVIIGGNMLRESFSKEEECPCADFSPAVMLPLAVATSIDALAMGVSFMNLSWRWMLIAVALIGGITFAVSAVAVKLGSLFGAKYKKPAERLGGGVLVLLGLKFLLEAVGVL